MTNAICSVEGCERAGVRRGWCMLHYNRWNRTGDPGPAGYLPPRRVDVWERIVKAPSGCWIWVGPIDKNGYGRLNVGRRKPAAHRYVYEMLVGEIPEGLVIDHLCRVHRCVNPIHLEPVTNLENLARGIGLNARAIRDNTCARGHALVGENVRRRPDRPNVRICLTCQREYRSRKEAGARRTA